MVIEDVPNVVEAVTIAVHYAGYVVAVAGSNDVKAVSMEVGNAGNILGGIAEG